MTKIKFGTDGWRAIIAKDYTVDNVKRVAEGTALWMKKNGKDKVVVGHDCRFGGQMFAEVVTQVFGLYGIRVHLAKGYVSTPMVSLGVVKTKADLGVVITASHNPPSYNGYKLKSHFGGPTIPKDIAEVEAMLPDQPTTAALPSLDSMFDSGLLNYIDLEEMYLEHVREHFDLEMIKKAKIGIAYDAMYGAGQRAMKRLLPDAHFLHCDDNPGFKGQAPEPIARNLTEISEYIKSHDEVQVGIANDGDADRIGMFNANGDFVDSHHILLLLLYYLHKEKGMSGKVIYTFSVTDKMKHLADKYGLDSEVTKIGFKYIAEIMIQEDVLVGGEESGGLAVKGHIPERDGIWIGLMILEFMAKTGKTLEELIQLIYDEVGSFSFNRYDLHISNELKQTVIQTCKNDPFKQFGDFNVQRIESVDGYKFYFNEEEWVMIRPSGTEPVLRVYAQAPNAERVKEILDTAKATILAVSVS